MAVAAHQRRDFEVAFRCGCKAHCEGVTLTASAIVCFPVVGLITHEYFMVASPSDKMPQLRWGMLMMLRAARNNEGYIDTTQADFQAFKEMKPSLVLSSLL